MCGFQEPFREWFFCKISFSITFFPSFWAQSYANTLTDNSRASYLMIIIYIIHQKFLKSKRQGACSFLFAFFNVQALPICLQISKSRTLYCWHLAAQDILHEVGHALTHCLF